MLPELPMVVVQILGYFSQQFYFYIKTRMGLLLSHNVRRNKSIAINWNRFEGSDETDVLTDDR